MRLDAHRRIMAFQMTKLKRNLLVAIPVAAALGAAALWWMLAARPAAVFVAEARIGPAVEAVYATGTVEPVRSVRIQSLVAERIEAVEVEEGDEVGEGAVLVRLDDRALRAEVEKGEADLRFLRAELARNETLAEKGIVSARIEERARSELDRASAALDAARGRLDDYALKAPMAGVVLRRDAEPGEIAKPGDTLVHIGRPRPARVVAEIDEEDIPRVAVGQRAVIRADAFGDRVMEGRVSAVTPLGDVGNRSFRVRVALPDDSPLRLGMTVEVNVLVRTDERAVLVPEAALADGGVFAVVDGRAERRPVEVGVVGDGWAEIRAGVEVGETVILAPPDGLADGAPVRVRG